MNKLKFWIKLIALLLLWGILLPHLMHAQPGSPDLSFAGGKGYGSTPVQAGGHAVASGVAIQPDGKIVAVGGTWIPSDGNSNRLLLLRYLPNGNLDLSFGLGGKVAVKPIQLSCSASDVLLLPDGKLLCVGGAWDDNKGYFIVARFHANGNLDTSFDGDGFWVSQPWDFAWLESVRRQADGKIVAAGYIHRNGYDEFAAIRLLGNGALDVSFGNAGIATVSVANTHIFAKSVLVQPDGKLAIAGSAVVGGYDKFAIARLHSNGALDNSFGNNGIAVASITNKNDRLLDAALQADGKIVATGYAGDIGAVADVEIAAIRLNANGSLDDSFGNQGKSVIHASNYGDDARAIVVQPDGKLLLGGHSRSSANAYHFTVVRLLPDGQLDPSFGGGDGIASLPISTSTDQINAMALQTDGKLVAVGSAWFDGFHEAAIARFLTGLTVGTETPGVFVQRPVLSPNPIRAFAQLDFALENTESVVINLYDPNGRLVQNLKPSTEMPSGKHSERLLFPPGCPPGVYYLAVETPRGIAVTEAIFY